MMTRSEFGRAGEDYACEMLRERGFAIVARNWHSRQGEVDIIASNERYLLFVEVKTRQSDSMVTGLEAVDVRKQRKIYKTAEKYLAENPTELQPRFDVISIIASADGGFTIISTDYIENSFGEEVLVWEA